MVVTVIVAVPTVVPSAAEVAVSVTEFGLGALDGATYVTIPPDVLLKGETVPHAEPVHPVPETVQFTVVLEVLLTVAANCALVPAGTVAVPGETTTVMAGAVVNVIVAESNFVASATDVAVSVTVGEVGTVAGGV